MSDQKNLGQNEEEMEEEILINQEEGQKGREAQVNLFIVVNFL